MPTKPKTNYRPGTQDSCQTPAHALEPLLPYIQQFGTIWEPCAGEGTLVSALLKANHKVVFGDIQTGEDFFEYRPEQYNMEWDCLVTNPPFSLKYDFIERALQLGKPFALLVPFETMAAHRYQQVALAWYNTPYRLKFLAPTSRINYKMPKFGWPKKVWNEEKQKFEQRGSAQMPTGWLTAGLDIQSKLYTEIYQCNIRSARYSDETNQEIL